MDLNKPSLYAAFGNKEQLYAAAVDHYVANVEGDSADTYSSPPVETV